VDSRQLETYKQISASAKRVTVRRFGDFMNVDTVGVAGLGLLGRGIAACLLAHGFRVVAFTTGEQTYGRARDYISAAIRELIRNAGFPESLDQEWPQRFVETQTLSEFAACGFVIESVVEDTEIKQDVFDQLEAAVAAQVPIASNTSAIPITLLQAKRKHPERLLGMHWAEPAYATRFLEVIRGGQTSEQALSAAIRLGRHVGKEPGVVQQDIPGFIVNRLGYAMYREAVNLLEMGVGDVETIDRGFRNACGLWATLCGPFRWIDITGGPALYAKTMQNVLPALRNSAELPKTLQTMLANQDRGVLNGRGFYSYQPGDAARWETLLHEHAWEVRRLQERYYPLRDEEKVEGDSDHTPL
jgi:3-hydroxybutyryl-CoA dehydrogenase